MAVPCSLFYMLTAIARLPIIIQHLPSGSIRGRTLMSTFTLPCSNPAVAVNLTSNLSQEQLLAFPAFQNWVATLQHSISTQQNQHHTFHAAPYKLRKIDIQSADFFGGKRLGFLKLQAEVSNDKGEKLPGSVFLRGGSVGMMVRKPATLSLGDTNAEHHSLFFSRMMCQSRRKTRSK